MTALAKKYGIATPYTSYLIVPDGPLPTTPVRPGGPVAKGAVPFGLMAPPGAGGGAGPGRVLEFARKAEDQAGRFRAKSEQGS